MKLRDESDLGLRGEQPAILTKVIAQAPRRSAGFCQSYPTNTS
jgi:hypothetical protein